MPSVDKKNITNVAKIAKETLKEMGEYDEYEKAKACCKLIRESHKSELLERFEDLYEEHSDSIVNGHNWLDKKVVLKLRKKKRIAIGKAYQYLEKQSNSVLGDEKTEKARDDFLFNLYSIFYAIADTQTEQRKIQSYLDKITNTNTEAENTQQQSSQNQQSTGPQKDPFNFMQNMVGKLSQQENGLEGLLNTAMDNPEIEKMKQSAENNTQLQEAYKNGDISQIMQGVFNDENIKRSFQNLLNDSSFFSNILATADPERNNAQSSSSSSQTTQQEYSE